MPDSFVSDSFEPEAQPLDPAGRADRRRVALNNVRTANFQDDAKADLPWTDTLAEGALGFANGLDVFGLADEAKGALTEGGRALMEQRLPTMAGYEHFRDEQRQANRDAAQLSPNAYQGGEIAGQVAPLALAPFSSIGEAAAEAPSALRLLASGAKSGAALGAASGLGHAEGDAGEQIEQAGKGALYGAATGLAASALPAAALGLAPEASAMPAMEGLRLAPAEAAAAIGDAAQGAKASLLRLGAPLVEQAPRAVGGAIGGAAGSSLAGPVGIGAGAAGGAYLGDKVAGEAARGLAGRMRAEALRLRPPEGAPAEFGIPAPDLESAPGPSGLSLATEDPRTMGGPGGPAKSPPADTTVPNLRLSPEAEAFIYGGADPRTALGRPAPGDISWKLQVHEPESLSPQDLTEAGGQPLPKTGQGMGPGGLEAQQGPRPASMEEIAGLRAEMAGGPKSEAAPMQNLRILDPVTEGRYIPQDPVDRMNEQEWRGQLEREMDAAAGGVGGPPGPSKAGVAAPLSVRDRLAEGKTLYPPTPAGKSRLAADVRQPANPPPEQMAATIMAIPERMRASALETIRQHDPEYFAQVVQAMPAAPEQPAAPRPRARRSSRK